MSAPASLRHVRDTLSSIVDTLATGLEPIYKRLECEFRTLKTLRSHDFPDELREFYEEIMNALDEEEARKDEGQLPATLEGMADETAQEIAGNIVNLYRKIEEKYRCAGSPTV